MLILIINVHQSSNTYHDQYEWKRLIILNEFETSVCDAHKTSEITKSQNMKENICLKK